MYIQQSSQRPVVSIGIQLFILALSLLLLGVILSTSAQAQSYQQRQKIARFQQQQRILMQKRARYRQHQRQKNKNTGGLFGALFAPQQNRRRAVRRRPVLRASSPLRSDLKKLNTHKKIAKSKNTLNFNNTKTKKLKFNKSRIPSKTSKKRRGGRAMCVRLCDGFYWPVSRIGLISKKTSNKAICQNSCSATTHVYYAGYSGDAGNTMQDHRGNRYKNLKNAFLYRKTMNKTCRCRPEPWTDAAQKMYDQRARNSEKLLLSDLSDEKQKAKRTAKFRTSMID